MKKRSNTKGNTMFLILLFIVFAGIDLFLMAKWASIEVLTIFWIFTVILWAWIYSNIQSALKLKKAKRLKKKWIAHPIDAKVIRFQLSQSNWEKSDYCFVASDWESEFVSEPFKWEITWYDEERLRCLLIVCIDYNILDIESTIKEIEQIQTTEDIMNRWQNHSAHAAKLLNSYASAVWTDFNWLLSNIRRCEEYLKSQANNPNFHRSYLEYNNRRIFVWDIVKVYIDPSDNSVYWIDTDYLYN
jgi:hypothetical protein